MRIRIESSKEVYEGATPEAIWRQLHEGSEFVSHEAFRDYLDGVVLRLKDIKAYIAPTAAVKASDAGYADWMLKEFVRLKRMSETDEPTTAEKLVEDERKKAEAAKAKAAAAAKAKAEAEKPAPAEAKPAAAKPAPAARSEAAEPPASTTPKTPSEAGS